MDTHFLIAFDPEAAPPAPPVEPAPAVALTFAVVLNGVRSMHTVPPGLSAQLTIPFSWAGTWARLCERAAFAGISPLGHAPLILPSASYLGSTCQYAPGDAQPWIVYLDDPQSAQVLKIGPPTENLWSWFQWPTATVTFTPDLTAHEQRPPLWFGIASFTDVQIPMRLQFEIPPDPLDPKPTTILVRELIYDDAPTFTASAYRVTCSGTTEHPLPMEVTGPEIATALLEAGYTDEGTYNLHWLIYRGAGDMVYRARCIESDLGTVTDRIQAFGGGFGTDIDTNLMVRQVNARYRPGPFWCNSSAGQFSVRADASYRAHAGLWVGGYAWLGTLASQPAALSWSSNGVFLAGRVLYGFEARVLCAACREVEADDTYPAHTQVLALVGDGTEQSVYRYRLLPGETPTAVQTLARPVLTLEDTDFIPAVESYQFSEDATGIICYAHHVMSYGDNQFFGGAVWVLAEWAVEEAAWALHTALTGADAETIALEGEASWADYFPLPGAATAHCFDLQYGYDECLESQELDQEHAPPNRELTGTLTTILGADWVNHAPRVVTAVLTIAGTASTYVHKLTTPLVTQWTGFCTALLGAQVELTQSYSGSYTRTLAIRANDTALWSATIATTEYQFDASGSSTDGDDIDPQWSGSMTRTAARQFDLIKLTRPTQNNLVCVASQGHWREENSEASDLEMNPAACAGELFAFPLTNHVTPTVIASARLHVNDRVLTHPYCVKDDDGYGATNITYDDADAARAHLRSVMTLLYNKQAFDQKSALDTEGNLFAWFQVDYTHALTRVHDSTDWQTVLDENEDDLFENASMVQLGVVTPHACWIPADPDATLPSGDPVIPPTYDALLAAIQAARAAAGVPSAQGDPVITDLAVTGGLTYTETFLSVAAVGVIAQTWTLIITDAVLGTFRLDGDTLGEVATGSPNATLAPLNPDTNTPYFVLLPGGWGGVHPLGATLTFRTAPAPLTEDAALVIAAAIHCQWMLDHASVTELGIDDTTPLARARLAGYAGASVGELRGVIATTVQEPLQGLCDAWLADPDTAAILLDPAWTRLGGYLIPWPGTGYLACVACGTEPPNE